MSDMAMSDSKMFGGGTAVYLVGARDGGGVGLQPGLEYKVAKALYAISNFNIFMPSAGPLCQVTKSSQPLFLFFPVPTGLDRVDEFTWPPVYPSLVLFLHNSMSCKNKTREVKTGGHVNSATRSNPVGPGKNKNKGWDDFVT